MTNGMSNEMHLPTARYVLPSFIEQSAYGTKETNPYAKLFEERIIFLGTQVDDTSANDIMAQLLVLEGLDPDRDITMYINSPGGSFTSLMAIYDPMQYVRPDVRTACLGQAASAAAAPPGVDHGDEDVQYLRNLVCALVRARDVQHLHDVLRGLRPVHDPLDHIPQSRALFLADDGRGRSLYPVHTANLL